jgi:hypothetical protein
VREAMPKSTVERLRVIFSSFGDVTEGTHSGALAFKTNGKLFATYREKTDEIVFGLEPDHLDALLANEPAYKKYPRAPAAVIRGADVDDWNALRGYLRESYGLVAKKRVAKKPTKRGRRA